jgi:hypothetical protein
MLVQLYRIGPTRQRIQKGFIVSGPVSENDLKRVLGNILLPFGKLRLDENRERVLWIDTGMVWLHTAQAREECFRQLYESTQALSIALNPIGGTLIPNAVRTSRELTWDEFLCGDRHFLELEDAVEKEVMSNFLRLHVPTLIAYSGRAGLEQSGVERVGSRRLLISQDHYAARYLVSLSPKHLERVKQSLRRDDGVSQLNYLDINPLGDTTVSESSIELRFIDSQALLSSVRAQAILIQAMFIKARRLVRDGRRVGDPDQKYLERNRARAISKAMHARFEKEPDRRGYQRSRKDGRYKEKNFISVDAIWLDLLESLQREFQILEVEYSEIAPLVLGTSLHQMGFAGLRNENDFFQAMSKTPEWQKKNWLSQITQHLMEPQGYQLSPLQSMNETRYPIPSQLIRRWWTLALRYDPKQKKKEKRSDHRPKPRHKSSNHSSLRSASLNLANTLKKLGGNHTSSDLVACLQIFNQTAGVNEINRGLGSIPHQDAQLIRRAYRSLKGQFKLYNIDKAWEDNGARKAIGCTRRYGLSLLSFIVGQEQESQAKLALEQLQETLPDGLNIYILSYWKFKSRKSGKRLLKIEIILTKPLENKAP